MTDHAALLPRYRHLREVARKLATTLTTRLSKDVVHEGAQALGMLQRGVLVFGSEAEMGVLMDYCIHDVRRHGRNAVEQYLAEEPFGPDSDETLLLRAHARAVYTMLLFETAEPGVGVQVRDVFHSQPRFIYDVNFSQTGEPGAVLASRIIDAGGITMTTGAALPFAQVPEHDWPELPQHLQPLKEAIDPSDPDSVSQLTAEIIRLCLARGGGDHIQHEDSLSGRAPSRLRPPGRQTGRPPRIGHTGRVGRNDPCPCGSGKKFKNCCYGRR
jgi:hypothetical protein